jgi:uncharacterized protein YjbI with pentapeptide repeats
LQAVCKGEQHVLCFSQDTAFISNSSSLLFVIMCRNSFHIPSFALMNLRSRPDKSNNNITSKAIAAIPIAGILVAAALLLGLLSVIGSETVIAQQQNMTGTNVTNATAAGANVTNATAAGANVTNATAAGANVTNATAAGANVTNATGTTGG